MSVDRFSRVPSGQPDVALEQTGIKIVGIAGKDVFQQCQRLVVLLFAEGNPPKKVQAGKKSGVLPVRTLK